LAVLPLKYVGEAVLRRKADRVPKVDKPLARLLDDMVETMRQAPGVGLAAPQVGVAERVIVVEYYEHEEDEENEDEQTPAPKRLYTLVNPEITRASKEMEVGAEGCLSIPGVMGDVERHLAITVKAQNRRGQPVTLRLKDWTARIFQHEIDHLNGVLFTDRASKVWKPEGAVEDNV